MIKQVPGQRAQSDRGEMRIAVTLYDEEFRLLTLG